MPFALLTNSMESVISASAHPEEMRLALLKTQVEPAKKSARWYENICGCCARKCMELLKRNAGSYYIKMDSLECTTKLVVYNMACLL